MKENHKSVAILAPTLPSSNISINETKFNVFPVPDDGNCFFHSLSFILNRDFSMSNNYRQLICTFILQNWASWEDYIFVIYVLWSFVAIYFVWCTIYWICSIKNYEQDFSVNYFTITSKLSRHIG
jgi:hypothetical protein